MTRDEYGLAYEQGCKRTRGFLIARGVPEEEAAEVAQAAWVRGWERLHQLREPRKALPWVNSIALNLRRGKLEREAGQQELREFPVEAHVNIAAIDVDRMLRSCKHVDRAVLRQRYLEDCDMREIACRNRCSEIAARVRLARARKGLRERFSHRPKGIALRLQARSGVAP